MSNNTTDSTTQPNNPLNVLKVAAEYVLVLGFIFFEELIWKQIVPRVKNFISGLALMEKVRTHIEAQNVYTTLTYFLVPLIAAELMGIQSGILIVSGYFLTGVALYALKIPVAGITFWIFSFSKDKLLALEWFASAHKLVNDGFDWVRNTNIYKSVKVKAAAFKEKAKAKFEEFKSNGGGDFAKNFKSKYENIKKSFKDQTSDDDMSKAASTTEAPKDESENADDKNGNELEVRVATEGSEVVRNETPEESAETKDENATVDTTTDTNEAPAADKPKGGKAKKNKKDDDSASEK